jgi:tripartite-type tricarboxylate transporter receptor subunit TctC
MVTTPGTPADRIKILREAYLKTFEDAEVAQEAKKSRLDLQALPGAEVETQIRDVMNQPKDVVARVKKLSE